jgi:orotate phosphoribosyltransferase
MKTPGKKLAQSLLQINAIQLNPQKPFQWASGLLSPIYCDNRLSLSHPKLRKDIKVQLCQHIQGLDPSIDVVVGVATAGIPQAALIADALDLPLLYVRSKPKAHGRQNLIEGQIQHEMNRAVVIEDLISTGQSSLKAVSAIRENGMEVAEVLSIFTYGLDASREAFAEADCTSYSLTDYSTLIEVALEEGTIKDTDIAVLRAWRKDPKSWNFTS